MSGVWVFKNNGVFRLENPSSSSSSSHGDVGMGGRRKVLVYLPTGEVVRSYTCLEQILCGLGWERYYGDCELYQFHKHSSIDLISLPTDFSKFNSVYMYDIVVKNPNLFHLGMIRYGKSQQKLGIRLVGLLLRNHFQRLRLHSSREPDRDTWSLSQRGLPRVLTPSVIS
ncbi:flowering-promoting factor 1-like protein 2 [Senna tora]|uniref:Flowering-promoting factor 1-like protein 2 n=1 Tax=Senna tora TaxID=362788 RepID=A0A834WNM8_9FABA|nr:flowering-promoting factor 1-like protein 2 [Senna tora]